MFFFSSLIGLDDVYLFPVSVENIREKSNNFYEPNINPTGMHMEGTLARKLFLLLQLFTKLLFHD